MRLLTIIPARLGSTRLPNKPLRLLAGEPLIRAVVRNALAMGLPGELVVASDDRRVLDAVVPLGIRGVLTDRRHASGTERVHEVAARSEFVGAQIVVNLQGDEPFLTASAVHGAIDRVAGGDEIGTAAQSLAPGAERDPHRVKVAVDGAGRALGFFRSGTAGRAPCPGAGRRAIFQHIGVYAFTRTALARWTSLPPVPAERAEGLEQLRPLHHGMSIGVAVLPDVVPPGIDTEEDLRLAEERL